MARADSRANHVRSPAPKRFVAFAAIGLLVAASACRTPGLPTPAPEVSEASAETKARASAALGRYQRHAEATRGVRAKARSVIGGAAGSAFSRQWIVAERPDQLRVEVLGLLGQRALAVATDGREVQIYRAGASRIERRPAGASAIEEAFGISLQPEDALAALLAVPELSSDVRPTRVETSGAFQVVTPERELWFDAAGLLVAMSWQPPAAPAIEVTYGAWLETAAGPFFPHEIGIALADGSQALTITLSEVEWNPEIAPAAFSLLAP